MPAADRKRRRRAVPALLVDAAGAGVALGVSRSIVYRLDAEGALPAPVVLGLGRLRRRLWSVSELAEWAAAGCPPRHEWAGRRKGGAR